MVKKTRILIVKNEPLMAENLSIQLIKNGYDISGIATNLSHSVAILKAKDADLELIDIGLDGPEDGVRTAEELMKIKWIPIIYVTEKSLSESLKRVKETAPAAFLQKPLRPQELLVQIELALHNFKEGNLPSVFWEDSDLFFVLYNKGHPGLHVDDVLHIKADFNYAEVFLTSERHHKMYPDKPYAALRVFVPMGTLLRELPTHFFLLLRSEVINLKRIENIGKGNLFLGGHERTIPEGRRAPLFSQLRVIQRRKNVTKEELET